MERWLHANGPTEIKDTLLRSEYSLTLRIDPETTTKAWMNRSIAELQLPEGILVALVYREGKRLIPTGRTVLSHKDRVILIGEPEEIMALRTQLNLDSTNGNSPETMS